VIVLHRLGHQAEPFYLSPEMIVTVEANPDTVVTLTTGAKIIVNESPEVVVQRIRRARVEVLVDAAQARDEERSGAQPHGHQRRGVGEMLRVLESPPPAVEAS
jgi:flagellar protein FlbD